MDAVLQSQILKTLNSAKHQWLRVVKIKDLAEMNIPKRIIKNELDEMSNMGLVDAKVKPEASEALYRMHLDPNRPVDTADILQFLSSRITHRPTIARMAFELSYNVAALAEVIDKLVQYGVLERSLYLGESVIGLVSVDNGTVMPPEELEERILEALRLANSSWVGLRAIRNLGKIKERQDIMRAKVLEMARDNKISIKESKHTAPVFRMLLDKNREVDIEEIFEFVSTHSCRHPSISYIAQELSYTETAVGLAVEHLVARGDLVRRDKDGTYASTKWVVDHPAMRFNKKERTAKSIPSNVAAPRTFRKYTEYKWVLPPYIEERLRPHVPYKGVFSDPDRIRNADDA